MPSPPRSDRLPALDLLRCLAVVAVMAFHFGFNGPTGADGTYVALSGFDGVARYGYLGVQLFFIISGFVIAYSADRRSASEFAIGRVARIYPAFLFCMTTTFLLTLLFGAPFFSVTAGQWAANLIIAAPSLRQPYVDSVYWTLLLELTFYAWIYLLMLGGWFRRRIDTVVLIWLIVSLLNEQFIGSHALRKLFLTDQSGFFATGLLLYELYSGRRDAMAQGLLGVTAATAVVQAVANVDQWRILTGAAFDHVTVAAIALAMVGLMILAVRAPSVLSRLSLPTGLTAALGGLTYPLYLLHQKIGYVAVLRLRHAGPSTLVVPAVVAALVLASWATWRYVDRPGQQWMKRRLSRLLHGREQGRAPQRA